MAFRRMRRSFSRRRRSPWDMHHVGECKFANIVGAADCSFPQAGALLLVNPFQQINLANRAVTIGGIHFQVEYSLNPLNASEELDNVVDVHTIWEAIMVLPLAEKDIAGTPDYVPVITTKGNGDNLDRVLWKRITHMPFWGASAITAGQLQTTVRDTAAGPQIVKSKARLDERHGLFYVYNFVNGFVNGAVGYVRDSWFTIALKASR